MTKAELIAKLADAHPRITRSDAERVVNTMISRMSAALAAGGRVELRDFGVFSLHDRAARRGRNPRTGEDIEVPAKVVPFFKSGKGLRDRMLRPKQT